MHCPHCGKPYCICWNGSECQGLMREAEKKRLEERSNCTWCNGTGKKGYLNYGEDCSHCNGTGNRY